MATIPIYDPATITPLRYPMANTHEGVTYYLGGKALVERATATVNLKPRNNAEALALYTFWRDTCNFGIDPFLICLPIFGREDSQTTPQTLVRFEPGLTMNKVSLMWNASINLEVLGQIDDVTGDFIIDDLTSDYIIDADNNFIATGNNINSYRGVSYGGN